MMKISMIHLIRFLIILTCVTPNRAAAELSCQRLFESPSTGFDIDSLSHSAPSKKNDNNVRELLKLGLVAPFDTTDEELRNEIMSVFTRIEDSTFEVGRGMYEYFDTFFENSVRHYRNGNFWYEDSGPNLGDSLLKLGPNTYVIDLGAGAFVALRDLSDGSLLAKAAKDINGRYGFYGSAVKAALKFDSNGCPNMTGITMVDFNQQRFI